MSARMRVASRPEHEVLVCCARSRLRPEDEQRLRALASGRIDWVYLMSAADRHGMTPLVSWHLKGACPEFVPSLLRSRLKTFFSRNQARNLFLSAELARLLAALGDAGVRAVPFKGPLLAELAYGSVALREFQDLDVLVHQQDWTRAEKIMLSNGYTRDLRLTPAQAQALDEEATKNATTRAGAARLLVVQQLRYLRFKRGRERRGLGAFKPRTLVVDDKEARAVAEEAATYFESKGAPATPTQIAFNVASRLARDTTDGPKMRRLLAIARSVLNERRNAQLERDMQSDAGLRNLGQKEAKPRSVDTADGTIGRSEPASRRNNDTDDRS